MVVMMSEGDAPHLVAAVLIGCLAAPLIEEVLFRGIFLESLRRMGNAVAIWLSAAAFAVWHLNLAALRYYALLGALLGWLYVRRGLVCSMAAHLGFNGVLTVAAMSVVLSGGGSVTGDGLTVSLPQGWSQSSAVLPAQAALGHPAMLLRGPSGATIAVLSFPTPTAPSRQRIADLIRDPEFARLSPGLMPLTLREVTVGAGTLIEVDARHEGEPGTVAFLCRAGTSYEIVFRAAGSPKAARDLPDILSSMQVA
jgi:hypothetical protein